MDLVALDCFALQVLNNPLNGGQLAGALARVDSLVDPFLRFSAYALEPSGAAT